ncbi:MAG: thioredoxin domain-containing protein [Methanosarcinales archaeon]
MEIRIGKTLLIIIILIAIGIVAWSTSGYFVKDDNSLSDLDKFAKCLTEKGATVYVSQYCGHCKHQKEIFGESFKYVNSVECTENQELCQKNGIRGVPTWILNGASYPGVQQLETLSSLTGCSLS